MSNNDPSEVLLEYKGPAVEDGFISADRMIQAVSGINNAYKKFAAKKKIPVSKLPELRLSTKSGSWELIGVIAAVGYTADKLGITEFSRNFFGEVGTQLALKLFAKKEEIKLADKPQIESGVMYVILINSKAEQIKVNAEAWEFFKSKLIDKEISQLVSPIEESKIDTLKYAYKTPRANAEISINQQDRQYLVEEEQPKVDLDEDFDDSKAETLPPLKGRLVAYNALASKYPFQFQPKGEQEGVKKFNIPCAVDEDDVNKFIELLKKAREGNFIINGIGIKDDSGLFKKMKITNVEEDRKPTLFDDE